MMRTKMMMGFTLSIALGSPAPTGSLFAITSDEYVSSSTWSPSSTCGSTTFGPCPANTSCCIDPAVRAAQGACYKTLDCTQLRDENITLGLRLVRFDLQSGGYHTSASMPLPPHSGALTRPVSDGKGQLFVQIAAMGGTYSVATYKSVPPAAPEHVSSCTLDAKVSGIWFDRNSDTLLASDANGTALYELDASSCSLTQLFVMPVQMVNFEPPPVPGMPPFAMPPMAVVDDLAPTDGGPSTLHFIAGRSVIGVELGGGRVVSNTTFTMNLISQQLALVGPGLFAVGSNRGVLIFNKTDASEVRARAVKLPADAGVLWAVSAAQHVLFNQAENRSVPTSVVTTIEGVDLVGGQGVVYRSPVEPMICAPGSYSCLTSFFSYVDEGTLHGAARLQQA